MENKKLLISIIVPIYRVEKYIQKCVDSIINQSYENIEIVLVDDGSDDRCPEICDEYARKDERIKVIHKKNGGLVSARKAGVREANGKYLTYVDGDDWISRDYINKFVDALTDTRIDIVWAVAHTREYDNNSRVSGFLRYSEEELRKPEIKDRLYRLASGVDGYQNYINFGICSKLFRKSFYSEIIESIDNRISFDEDFCQVIRCFAHEPNIIFIRDDGYHYLQRNDSMTHGCDDKDINRFMLDDTIKYLEKYSKPYLERYVWTQYYISMIEHYGLDKIQPQNARTIFPFKNAYVGKKIVLYGVGNAGDGIFEYLRNSEVCEVVAVCDKRFSNGSNYKGVRTISIDMINRIEADYVLISTIKQEFISEIKQELEEIGVEETHIAYIDYHKLANV